MTQDEMFKYLGVGVAGLMVIYIVVSTLDFNSSAILTLNKNSVAGIEAMTVREGMTVQEQVVDKRFDGFIKELDKLNETITTKINIDKNSRKMGDILDKYKEVVEKQMISQLIDQKKLNDVDKLMDKQIKDKILDKIEMIDKYRSLIEGFINLFSTLFYFSCFPLHLLFILPQHLHRDLVFIFLDLHNFDINILYSNIFI